MKKEHTPPVELEIEKVEDNAQLPSISHDEYLEIAAINNYEIELKTRAFDQWQAVENLRKALVKSEAILVEEEERLSEFAGLVESTHASFLDRLKIILDNHGISAQNVQVSNSEPHIVTINDI